MQYSEDILSADYHSEYHLFCWRHDQHTSACKHPGSPVSVVVKMPPWEIVVRTVILSPEHTRLRNLATNPAYPHPGRKREEEIVQSAPRLILYVYLGLELPQSFCHLYPHTVGTRINLSSPLISFSLISPG